MNALRCEGPAQISFTRAYNIAIWQADLMDHYRAGDSRAIAPRSSAKSRGPLSAELAERVRDTRCQNGRVTAPRRRGAAATTKDTCFQNSRAPFGSQPSRCVTGNR